METETKMGVSWHVFDKSLLWELVLPSNQHWKNRAKDCKTNAYLSINILPVMTEYWVCSLAPSLCQLTDLAFWEHKLKVIWNSVSPKLPIYWPLFLLYFYQCNKEADKLVYHFASYRHLSFTCLSLNKLEQIWSRFVRNTHWMIVLISMF